MLSLDDDRIRVLVVDEEPVVGAGVRALLAGPDFTVDAVNDAAAAAEVLAAMRPRVVLCDVCLNEPNGGRQGGLRFLSEHSTGPSAFIMFSSHAYPTFYLEAVAAGAAGFLPKTTSAAEMVRAIKRVARGGTAFSAAAVAGARAAHRRPAPRELEIVTLVAAGLSNSEIACCLAIGVPTVESVLRRLFDRYSVTNRTALARLAYAEGWLFGMDRRQLR
jgi:DNA-binding NarL/FixJ family response regulator